MSDPIIRRTFQLTDLSANNNKFWTVEFWPDGAMTTTWGRVGQTPQVKTKPKANAVEVTRLIREKERKGYIEIELHRQIPVAIADLSMGVLDGRVQRLVELIYREAMMQIQGYLAVDIHTLSEQQIARGRKLLRQIQEAQQVAGSGDLVVQQVQAYYNTIPTKLPARIDLNEIVTQFVNTMAEQEDRLNQLETGLAVHQAQAAQTNLSQLDALGGVEISPMDAGSRLYGDIADYVARTAQGARKIHEIFAIHIPEERTAWMAEKRGKRNVQSLFHGTKSWNMRHILKTGLVVPQVPTHGRRFGHGMYFADQARRSLNYTGGKLSPLQMLLVADVALGKPAKMSGMNPGLTEAPRGYDSVWGVEAFGGLDEFIVYKASQQTIRALVMLE